MGRILSQKEEMRIGAHTVSNQAQGVRPTALSFPDTTGETSLPGSKGSMTL